MECIFIQDFSVEYSFVKFSVENNFIFGWETFKKKKNKSILYKVFQFERSYIYFCEDQSTVG